MQGARENLMNMNAIARNSKRKKAKILKAPKQAPSANRGFALIITISLMILLVLIGVGMLTLSSITLRTASQETANATARANARLALMLAIGDLQRNAGPDQFVTARAEILDTNPSTPVVDGVKQPYWTGTWKTGAYSLDVHYAGQSQTQRSVTFNSSTPSNKDVELAANWLVSDPNPITPAGRYSPATSSNRKSFTPVTSGTGFDPTRNAVKLATNQGTDTNTQEVDVPLVGITDPTKKSTTNAKGITGSFGYWVADEGLKAKVNMVDPTMASGIDPAKNQTHFLASQANAIQKINNKNESLAKNSQNDFRTANTTDQLGKTVTYKTVGLLPTISTGAQVLNNFMPDVTTESRGVIVDVKDGGLKKDLTSAFENSAAFDTLTKNYGYGSLSAYRNCASLSCPSAPSYGTMTDGLPWVALFTYYNTYKSVLNVKMLPNVQTSGTIVPFPWPGSGSPDITTKDKSGNSGNNKLVNNLPCTVNPRYVMTLNNGVAGKFGGLFPELLASRMDIGLMGHHTTDASTGKTLYSFYVCYHPQLVLYNPYNCTLTSPGQQYVRRYRTGQTPGDHYINIWVENQLVINHVLLNQWTPWEGFSYEEYINSPECDNLAPGETRVFCLAADHYFADGADDHGTPTSGMAMAIGSGVNPLKGSGPKSSDQYKNYADVDTYTGALSDNTTIPGQFKPGPVYKGTSNANAPVVISIDSDKQGSTAYRTQCNGGMTRTGWPDIDWPNTNYGNGQGHFTVDGPDESTPAKAFPPHLIISSMVGNEYTLCSYFLRNKGINPDSTNPNNNSYFNGKDVIPIFHGNAAYFSPFETVLSGSRRELFISNVGQLFTSDSEVQAFNKNPGDPNSHYETWFGNNSVGIADGTSPPARRVLRDVPEQPLLSIGQFMHIPTMVYNVTGGGNSRDPGSMYIGGSMCSPFVPIGQNATLDSNTGTLLLDDSYMANDALFDRFFFSTVPPATPDGNAPQQWTDFNQANPGNTLSTSWDPNTKPLPNSRIKPLVGNGTTPLMADLRDLDKAAANLMLDGAFNVNSTSVAAWTAFLSSLSGNSLLIYDAAAKGSATIQSGTLHNFIPRFWSGGTAQVNAPWSAGRALSDNDVAQLAANIVQQVKTRGPFLSMADFLNRRLGGSGALGRVGCLQAAIDKSPVNNSIKSAGVAVNPQPFGMPMTNTGQVPSIIPANLMDGQDGSGSTLNTTYGMPGYLMQQDLVQAFSPAMTVRSDTFLIRAYGECVNPLTGEIQAKAWAEAVVQRVPAFLDSTTDPDPSAAIPKDPSGNNNTVPTGVKTLQSNVNITLGRRFKVAGFRWLSSNEL